MGFSVDQMTGSMSIDGNYADATFTNGSGVVNVTMTNGKVMILNNIHTLTFNGDSSIVRIVGNGGYGSLSDATSYTGTGTLNVYVTDSTLAAGSNGSISYSPVNIILADTDTGATNPAVMSITSSVSAPIVNIYGTHSFTITANNNGNTILDHTVIASGYTNTITGGNGDDVLCANISSTLSVSNGYTIITGMGGTNILIGGFRSRVTGGSGTNTLLALGAGAILTGSSSQTYLMNGYSSTSVSEAVTLTRVSGNLVYGLIGNPSSSGKMNTTISALATGDKIDLSLLGFVTSSDFTSSGGTATINTAGTRLTFPTSSIGGTLLISNAKTNNVTTAINAGGNALSNITFAGTFGATVDTYSQSSVAAFQSSPNTTVAIIDTAANIVLAFAYLQENIDKISTITLSDNAPIIITQAQYNNYQTNYPGVVQKLSGSITVLQNVACFLGGTSVLTPSGYKSIESLAKGDIVQTADGRSVGVIRTYKKEVRSADPSIAPYFIPASCLGPNMPCSDLIMSPEHCVQVSVAEDLWLPARICAKLSPDVRQIHLGESFTYYNLILPNYFTDNLVVFNGVVVESMSPRSLVYDKNKNAYRRAHKA